MTFNVFESTVFIYINFVDILGWNINICVLVVCNWRCWLFSKQNQLNSWLERFQVIYRLTHSHQTSLSFPFGCHTFCSDVHQSHTNSIDSNISSISLDVRTRITSHRHLTHIHAINLFLFFIQNSFLFNSLSILFPSLHAIHNILCQFLNAHCALSVAKTLLLFWCHCFSFCVSKWANAFQLNFK